MERIAVRVSGLATLALFSTATVCSTLKAIAVVPPPGMSVDSTARLAFSVVERVTARYGLKPGDPNEALRRGPKPTCFSERSLLVCGQVNGPEVQFSLSQVKSIGFTPWADSVRTALLDSLRVAFGTFRVHECKYEWDWRAQRGGCPLLAARDTS